jgi:Flp pilus assembly pilin Flp
MRLKLQQFLYDERGTAAVEVGLIAAGICVAVITLAGQMNGDVKLVFERLAEFLRSLNLHAMT